MRQALAASNMLGDMDSGDGKTYLTDLELRNWGRLGECSAVSGRIGIGTGKQKNFHRLVVAVVDFSCKLSAVVVDDSSGKHMAAVVVDSSGKLAWVS